MHDVDPQRKLQTTGWLWHALGLSATFAVMLLASQIIYQPTLRERARLADELESLESLAAQSDEIMATNKRLREDLARMESQLTSMLERIPESPREADFLAQISELADDVGLQIVDYRPGTISELSKYNRMQVNLTSRGSYASICRFLNRLSRMSRLCRVTKLVIDAKQQEPPYRVEMTLAVYFAPREKLVAFHQGRSHESVSAH